MLNFKTVTAAPIIKSVDLKSVQLYMNKFEEAIRTFEEVERECIKAASIKR